MSRQDPRLSTQITPEKINVVGANQIWRCVACGTLRSWGFRAPENFMNQPLLRCRYCREATRHTFDHVSNKDSRGRGYE